MVHQNFEHTLGLTTTTPRALDQRPRSGNDHASVGHNIGDLAFEVGAEFKGGTRRFDQDQAVADLYDLTVHRRPATALQLAKKVNDKALLQLIEL